MPISPSATHVCDVGGFDLSTVQARSAPQAATCMRLAWLLTSPMQRSSPVPADDELRVPLGSLLLLLWVQHATHELGTISPLANTRAQVRPAVVRVSRIKDAPGLG